MTLALITLLAASPVQTLSLDLHTLGPVRTPSTLSLVARGLEQLVRRGGAALPTWLRVPAGAVLLFGVQWAGQAWLEVAADPTSAARDFFVRAQRPAQSAQLPLWTF